MNESELEELYLDAPLLPLPRGAFDGNTLRRLSSPGAMHPLYRSLEWIGFEALSWGIDFDGPCWFFANPLLRAGKFEPRPGRSRWRPTDAIGLHYYPSRLPYLVRSALYDEVKPLSDDLCLGIGGVNQVVGDGDHFFFVLSRR
ncbi:hypothetical protein BH09MYX1_BH09MYX1_09990 [soil metagenome]